MKWETVIGLETHAQLSTKSKMFSGAATAFGAAPNTQACAVDIALPGVLPVANRDAVEKAVRFGLAVGANINRRSIFARKNYFYPDLPKGYQISQYELPIVQGGTIGIHVDGREKMVRLTRAHLEEDAGKSFHGEAISGVVGQGVVGLMRIGLPLRNESRDLTQLSAVDLNRAGTPLLEIVSEPDMRSAQEAVAYAKALHTLVRWIGICDGNMQEGSFRCDANVSVRPAGSGKLGTRSEIKNLNSFRFLERAIEFEVKRQIEILEDGGRIEQETRLYDAERDETRSMRLKEEAHDYRYFPDPDLLPLEVSEQWIKEIETTLPELPGTKRERYERELLIFPQDGEALTASRETADYFEAVLAEIKQILGLPYGVQLPDLANAKHAANWVINDIGSRLNRDNISIDQSPVSPKQLAGLLARLFDGTISSKIAKDVFDEMWRRSVIKSPASGGISTSGYAPVVIVSADQIIKEKGLTQISDSGELERICDQVIAANARQVEDYRAGKDKAFNSLVGQAMKLSKGKANPQQVSEILKRKLLG